MAARRKNATAAKRAAKKPVDKKEPPQQVPETVEHHEVLEPDLEGPVLAKLKRSEQEVTNELAGLEQLVQRTEDQLAQAKTAREHKVGELMMVRKLLGDKAAQLGG